MKQSQSNNYTIAWFKLAECVSRGEKERALGVYRLLSHSIGDPAFVQQLQADLLLAFDDKEQALQKYQDAIQLYQQDERWLEAAGVYEHLITLEPKKYEYYINVLYPYDKLGVQSKIHVHIESALDLLITEYNDLTLQQGLAQIQAIGDIYYLYACDYLKK
jgi:tetratricopeptide (TPR) repeat protein